MPGQRRRENDMTTKKTARKQSAMREEYRFDYSQAKPNRFAAGLEKNSLAVVLDPDVAAVFQSSESVNTLLRSVISALPVPETPTAARTRRAL